MQHARTAFAARRVANVEANRDRGAVLENAEHSVRLHHNVMTFVAECDVGVIVWRLGGSVNQASIFCRRKARSEPLNETHFVPCHMMRDGEEF